MFYWCFFGGNNDAWFRRGMGGNTIRVVGDMMIRSHTDAVWERETLKASTQRKGPNKKRGLNCSA